MENFATRERTGCPPRYQRSSFSVMKKVFRRQLTGINYNKITWVMIKEDPHEEKGVIQNLLKRRECIITSDNNN